ncbi:MAG: M23 family metallopeptidase [Myxococcota bacterium]
MARLGLVLALAGACVLGFVAFSAADTALAGPAGVGDIAYETAGAEMVPVAGAVAAVRPETPAPPRLQVYEGSIRKGETIAQALAAHGVPAASVATIVREMRPHFDFRHARPGHVYRLSQYPDGTLVGFDYHTSTTSGYRMVRVGDGFEVNRQEVELVPRPALIAGLVSSTLYTAIVDLGEQGQLARDFADVFAWDIDFQRSVRPGDAFQIVYERLHRIEMDGSETYVRPGRILAARYDGSSGRHTAIYFEAEPGRGGYYKPNGGSVEGEFLMSPLRHGRITSSFTHARRHPILKITRPHPGIDYAAPHGTPVWSVADGEVIYRARAGGFGNLIKVRHKTGHISYYSHLSRYAKDLRVGDQVVQKQVIGFVGSTGLATGPHVCFRVQKDGKYVNPATLKTGSRAAIPEELLPTFRATRDMLLAELDGGAMVAAGVSQ